VDTLSRVQSSPLKLIRLKCLDCSENSVEVRLCVVFDCHLWMCRFGSRPNTFATSGSPWADPVFVQAEADRRLRREMGYGPDVDSDTEKPAVAVDSRGSDANVVPEHREGGGA
jgi:hypothetical protein